MWYKGGSLRGLIIYFLSANSISLGNDTAILGLSTLNVSTKRKASSPVDKSFVHRPKSRFSGWVTIYSRKHDRLPNLYIRLSCW